MPLELHIGFDGQDAITRQYNAAIIRQASQAGLTAAVIQAETEMVDAATRIVYSRPEGSRKRTGAYRASLGGGQGHIREIREGFARVGTNIFYAHFLEEGTKAHTIRPRSAKVLKFRGRGGKMVYAREVHHPGTPALHVLGTALSQGGPRINRAFTTAFMARIERAI